MSGVSEVPSGSVEPKIPVYVLNLASSTKRLNRVTENTKNMEKVELFRIEAFLGRDLTDLMCQLLTLNDWSPHHKGTLGCFISHSLAWQAIADQTVPFAMVMEDDAIIENYDVLAGLSLPPETDFVFCNRRTTYLDDSPPGSLRSVEPILEHLVANNQAVGGDGYLLTPQGAKKLIRFVKKDHMFSHVDLRMMAYCLNDDFFIPEEKRIDVAQNVLEFRAKYPKIHKLNAYSLFPHLTRHIFDAASERKTQDDIGLELSRVSKVNEAY